MISKPQAPAQRATKGAGSDLTHRSVVSVLWSAGGTALQIALQVFVLAGLARLLAPADFGTVSAALVVIGLADMISQFGFAQAVVQKSDLAEEDVQTAYTITILLGVSLAVVTSLCAPLIAGFYRNHQVEPVVRALAVVFPVSAVGAISHAILQRRMAFRVTARIQVLSYISYAVSGLGLAFYGAGLWALVIAYLVQAATKSLLLFIAQPHSLRLHAKRDSLRHLAHYGTGVTLGRIGAYCALQGDNLVAGRVLGAAALGFYSRAYNLMTVPVTLLGTALDNVMFSAMSSIQDEKQRLQSAYRRSIAVITTVAVPVTVFVVTYAPELVVTILGDRWSMVVAPLQVLTLSLMFRISYKVSDATARATGNVYSRAWRQYVYAALVIGGGFWGARYGIVGVATAVSTAIFVNYLWMAQLSMRALGMPWSKFLQSQSHGLVMLAFLAPYMYGSAVVSRWAFDSALLISMSGAFFLAVAVFCMAVFMPSMLLGSDGLWVLEYLRRALPKRRA